MSIPRVLVVDDDQLIRWALQKEFASLSLPARVAGSAREALDESCDVAYDLIFLDVNLPDANGLELLPELRKRSPNARIVVMSADAGETNRRRAAEGGISWFMEKPFDFSEVRNLVSTVVEDGSSTRKSPRYYCRIPVRLSIVTPVPGGSGSGPDDLDGLMADVGAGGLKIRTGYPLRAGQRVRARVDAASGPSPECAPLPGMAEVVWVEPRDGDVTAGLRFLP